MRNTLKFFWIDDDFAQHRHYLNTTAIPCRHQRQTVAFTKMNKNHQKGCFKFSKFSLFQTGQFFVENVDFSVAKMRCQQELNNIQNYSNLWIHCPMLNQSLIYGIRAYDHQHCVQTEPSLPLTSCETLLNSIMIPDIKAPIVWPNISVREKFTWKSAAARCGYLNAHLPILRSREESDDFIAFLKLTPHDFETAQDSQEVIFIGLVSDPKGQVSRIMQLVALVL